MITSVEELQGRKVALYGLSANPPTGHSGHLGVVEYLVETGLFDEVWILPVYQHMFSTKRAMESFHHRVAMCNLCMPGASRPDCKVHVKEIEKYAAEHYEEKEGSAFRVGTVDILDYILSSWPGLRLNLVLGTDTYQDLMARKWKQSDRILSMVTVHVIARVGIETTDVEVSVDHCKTNPHCITEKGTGKESAVLPVKVVHHSVPWLAEVSSTVVRQLCAELVDKPGSQAVDGKSEDPEATLKGLLDERVLQYIKENGLYGYNSNLTGTAEDQS